jgi:UDP-glucose:(heptosyl)LPS alpha-1,3-glucosyltransferase
MDATGTRPRTGAERDDAPGRHACDVTIVAHDIGAVGGMERQIAELVLGVRARGHSVTVIARTCKLPPDSGIDFHHVRGPGRPFLLAYPWFMLVGSMAVRRWRRGVVQSTGAIVVNDVDVIAVHYCHQVGPANPSRASPLFHIQVRAAAVLKRLGERLCYRPRRARAFACVSAGVADEMREHFPGLADRVVTIHNGVDTDVFAPCTSARQVADRRAEIGVSQDALLAVFVGSEWERKGLEPALRAIALQPEWTLAVVGSGDRPRYTALADELGVGAQVRWLGVRPDVERVYQLADAFVLPSSYETFSLVTFEAAATGLPVLATPVSGVSELIEDERNGFLIDRDPELIADRLRRLAEDPALRARLGSAARESALAYSSSRMVAEHTQLYERIASARRSGPA